MPDLPPRSDTGAFALIPEWLLFSHVSSAALRAYAVLGRYADYETGEAWPSQTTLANQLGVTTRSVRRLLAELEELGALRITPRYDEGGGQRSNVYTIIRVPPRTVDVQGGRTVSDEAPQDTLVLQNESHIEREPSEQKRIRDRDLVWDAFIEVHGQPATKSERGKFNMAVAKLKEAGVTAAEYPALVAAYVSKYSGSQPAVMTVAERVGEMRSYVKKGPLMAPNQHEVREHQRWQRLMEEHDDDTEGVARDRPRGGGSLGPIPEVVEGG